MFLEHPASQKTTKTAKKPPKMAPGSLQDPLKKKTQILDRLFIKIGPQNGSKSGRINRKNLVYKNIPQKIKID